MRDKHCSDESLVAHLDHELPSRAERAVAVHLALCWHCRSRAAELEAVIHSVARSEADQDYPGPDWVDASRAAFTEWRHRIDQEQQAVHFARFPGWFQPARLLWATPALVLLLAAAWLYWPSTNTDPGEIAIRAEQRENAVLTKPVHFVYGVQITQIKPAAGGISGSLRIWSDASSRRYSSRWENPNGTLRFAVWQPGSGGELVYDPDITSAGAIPRVGPVASRSFADIASGGLDLDQVSRGFVRWIESRRWQPVFIGGDLRAFTDGGVDLEVRRVRSAGGGRLIRLSARRVRSGMTVAVTVDLDADTYRASVQRIRFEQAGRVVELTLTTERTQIVERARLQPAVFEPDIPTVGSDLRRPEKRIAAAPRVRETAPGMAPEVSDSARAAREIEVRYALHQLGACEGEAIEVLEGPTGWPVVHGVVGSSARKQQLEAALAQLSNAGGLSLNIQASDEYPHSPRPPLAGAAAGDSARQRIAQTAMIGSERLPIEAALRGYLEENPKSQPELARSMAQYAALAVSDSESMFSEAWALRTLVQRYGERWSVLLPGMAEAQLATMLRDHLTSFERRSGELRKLLQPLLDRVADGNGKTGGEPAALSSVSYKESILAAFSVAKRVHEDVHYLFAGTPPADSSNAAPSSIAARISLDLRRLQREQADAAARVSSDLAAQAPR